MIAPPEPFIVWKSKGRTSCNLKRTPTRDHAMSMRESCGITSDDLYNGRYRCDLKRGHTGRHHACGELWEVQW